MPVPITTQPQRYNFVIFQGVNFYRPVVIGGILTPKNLTGCTATAKIKDSFTGALIIALACTIPNPTDGYVYIKLTKAQTAALVLPNVAAGVRLGRLGVWDLELDDGTDAYRFLEGEVQLSREATT